jgi:hypothetical protein
MTDELGPVAYDTSSENPFLGRGEASQSQVSDRTAERIDSEVRRIIEAAHAKVRKLLEDNRDVLDRLATKLIEVEVLSSEDFDAAIRDAEAARAAASGAVPSTDAPTGHSPHDAHRTVARTQPHLGRGHGQGRPGFLQPPLAAAEARVSVDRLQRQPCPRRIKSPGRCRAKSSCTATSPTWSCIPTSIF